MQQTLRMSPKFYRNESDERVMALYTYLLFHDCEEPDDDIVTDVYIDFRNESTSEFYPDASLLLADFLVKAGWPGTELAIADFAAQCIQAWKVTPKDVDMESHLVLDHENETWMSQSALDAELTELQMARLERSPDGSMD